MFKKSRNHTVKADPNELSAAFLSVRRAMGLAGLSLPILLYFQARFLPGGEMQSSISAFYHTLMGDIFVGILVAIGVFLISYTGYARKEGEWFSDWWVSNLAGLGAIGTAIFPTLPPGVMEADCGQTFFEPGQSQGFVFHWCDFGIPLHALSAGLFFLAMAVFCFALFPKSADGKCRYLNELGNFVYLCCGIALLVAIGALAYYVLVRNTPQGADLRAVNFVFWFETLGIVAFGIAWLTKGNTYGAIGNKMHDWFGWGD